MPASAAQVFGPTTVDPGFTTTGEKTLLTMATTLPAGGKNVILCAFMPNSAFSTAAQGTFRVYKGGTLLYETKVTTEYPNSGGLRNKMRLVIAVDNTPTGNDTYSFRLNLSAAGSTTGVVHVQAIVIKTDDAVWGYNNTAVSIANGSTATVTSISTTFPVGSKVAVIGVPYGVRSTGNAVTVIGSGTHRIKRDTTILASNEFPFSSYASYDPTWGNLVYLDSPTSSTQTYALEVYNDSGVTFNFYGNIVAFTVSDGGYLDTSSVTLTNGSRVTVGNLSTNLSGDVVAIALAAAGNISLASNSIIFNADDVVLQMNNSATGQISNKVGWVMEVSEKSGILPMFRFDTGVSNPTYQVKMTARASGINGEAKILAFVLSAGLNIIKRVGEAVNLGEISMRSRRRFRAVGETVNISEVGLRLRALVRLFTEALNLLEGHVLRRLFIRIFSENVNIGEMSRKAARVFRILAEQLRVYEGALITRKLMRTVSEPSNVVEGFVRIRSLVRRVMENVNIMDAVLITRKLVRVASETLNVVESTVKIVAHLIVKSVSEMVNVVEGFVGSRSLVRRAVETVNIMHAAAVARNILRSFVETLRIYDAGLFARNRFIRIAESISLTEAIQHIRGLMRSVAEIVNVSEAASMVRRLFRIFGEEIRLYWIANSIRGRVRALSEQVQVSESLALFRAFTKIIGETVRLFEVLSRLRHMSVVFGEVVRISELFALFLGRVVSVVETVLIREYLVFRSYIRRLVGKLLAWARGGGSGEARGGEF